MGGSPADRRTSHGPTICRYALPTENCVAHGLTLFSTVSVCPVKLHPVIATPKDRHGIDAQSRTIITGSQKYDGNGERMIFVDDEAGMYGQRRDRMDVVPCHRYGAWAEPCLR